MKILKIKRKKSFNQLKFKKKKIKRIEVIFNISYCYFLSFFWYSNYLIIRVVSIRISFKIFIQMIFFSLRILSIKFPSED